MYPTIDSNGGYSSTPTTYTPPETVVPTQSQPEETLYQVGARYGVSQEQISAANPSVVDGNTPLPSNTTVNIPVGQDEGQAKAHVFQSGDDLAEIAASNGITEQALREANNLGPGEAVYPDMTLLIPGKGGNGTQANTNGGSNLTSLEKLQKQFPSLAGRNAEDMQKIANNVGTLRDGSIDEKIKALAELTRDLKPEELDTLAKELGLQNNPVYKLITDGNALSALATLANPKASNADKASAALTLLKDLGGLVPGKAGEVLKPYLDALPAGKAIIEAYNTFSDPAATAAEKITAGLTLAESLGKLAPEKLQEALGPVLSALPSGEALVNAIVAWADPNASALEKAKATLALAQAVRDSAGDAFPSIAHNLRSLDSSLRSIGAGLTLLDPNATIEEKAEAALTLAADVPQIAGDLKALKEFLVNQGINIGDATDITRQIENWPAARRLPESVRNSISPEVARNLTPEQADQIAKRYAESAESLREQALKDIDPSDLNKVAAAIDSAEKSAQEFGQSISKALGKIGDKEALNAFIKTLDSSSDHAARKALVETIAGLKPGVADKLLTSTIDGKPAAEVLSGVLDKLKDNPEALKKFNAIIAEGDDKTLKLVLQLGNAVDGKILTDALNAIGDAKLAGTVLRAIAGMLDKAGVKLTAEIAEKVLKGVAKAIPLAGAIPAVIDAADMARIAADTSLPPAIRYMAAQAAKLNAADAGLSVAEVFLAEFGVPIAVDIAIAIAGVGLDIIISDQRAKYEADPSGYTAPDWFHAVNVLIASQQGPMGAAEFALYYGPNGAVDVVGSLARSGGKTGIKAAELQQQLTAQGVGEGLHLTAEGLHVLADIVRNPKKYGAAAAALGEAAVNKLAEAARGAGELAKEAAKELGNLVNDLKAMGADGIKALGWIATHPGEAATKAINALSSLADQGLKLAGEAGKALTEAALTALGEAKKALAAAGDAAKEALAAAEHAIENTIDSAIKLGKEGIEALGWIAKNPGAAADIAKQALVDLAAKAGELAKEAYDQLVGLGEDGVELIKDVANRLKEAGEAGVEMLKYVVNNPGEAAEAVRTAAMDALKTIAEGVGDAANAATDAVIGFVDNGIQEAKDTATELLKAGGDAAKRIAAAWSKELSDGAKEVISGLKDLGDAGAEALGELRDAGISFAGDLLNDIGNAAKNATGKIPGTPW